MQDFTFSRFTKIPLKQSENFNMEEIKGDFAGILPSPKEEKDEKHQ